MGSGEEGFSVNLWNPPSLSLRAASSPFNGEIEADSLCLNTSFAQNILIFLFECLIRFGVLLLFKILMVQTFGCYHLAGDYRASVPLGRGGQDSFSEAELRQPAREGGWGWGKFLWGFPEVRAAQKRFTHRHHHSLLSPLRRRCLGNTAQASRSPGLCPTTWRAGHEACRGIPLPRRAQPPFISAAAAETPRRLI